MEVEDQQVETNNDEPLLGVTMTRNIVTLPLHGVTDLKCMDHSYSRHLDETNTMVPDYYATTEDEDEAIDGLLCLSATDLSQIEFPGDNGQLMPIGKTGNGIDNMCDTGIDTAEVTAAIENIALEETVDKTTSTVSTQTTFTRQRHRPTINSSGSDTDDQDSKKPVTRAQSRERAKKAEFKTVKYGLKKRRSSRTYACKECGKRKRDMKELNKHYKHHHKPVMCGICNQLFSLPSTLDKHMWRHLCRPLHFSPVAA